MKTQIETKHDELRFKTNDTAKMLNRYTAVAVIAEYPEDLVNEDGTVVTVKRTQKLFDAGTYINKEVASKLAFYLQSGDIKEVEVSNQKRLGHEYGGGKNLYIVQVRKINTDTKVKLMAYAKSVRNVLDIVGDYGELKFDGAFEILNVKNLDSHIVITDTIKHTDTTAEDYLKDKISGEEYAWAQYKGAKDENNISEADFKFYQITALISLMDDKSGIDLEENFIVHTYDGSKAEKCIVDYVAKKDAALAKQGFEVKRKTISFEKVAQLAVGIFIPEEFSVKHANNES